MMRFRLSMRARILTGFVLVFLLFLLVLGYTLVQMRQIRWQLALIQDGYLPLTRVVVRLENDRQGMEVLFNPERLLTRERSQSSVYFSLVDFHLNRLKKSLDAGRESVSRTLSLPGAYQDERVQAGISEKYQHIETLFSGLERDSGRFLHAINDGNLEAARKMVAPLAEQMSGLSRAIRELNDLLEKRMDRAVQLTLSRQEQAFLMSAALSLCALIFGLLMLFATHLVLRPIARLIEGVKHVARGDYAQRVPLEADDEIGSLAREFNVMAGRLAEREASLLQSRAELEAALKEQRSAHFRLKELSLYNDRIIQSIEVGLIGIGPSGRVTSMNRAAEVLFKTLESQVIAVTLEEHPLLSLLDAPAKEVLQRGELVRQEGLALRLEGGERLMDVMAVPLAGGEEPVQGVILLVEDVTERTRTKQRLIQNERLALIGRMSAQVTHEIRNPLNSLGLNTEMLQDELKDLDPAEKTEANALLSSISKEIDRLTQITETYLRMARLPTPRLEREQPGRIVESLLRFMASELEQREIEVRCELEPELPEAMVDDGQLRQALLNILRNAAEAIDGQGVIYVKVSREEDTLDIAIRDSGRGMTEEARQRVFDPFYSTKATGTGLGLPIAQQVIEEHGGQIICESAEGEGTVFRIRLPVLPPVP